MKPSACVRSGFGQFCSVAMVSRLRTHFLQDLADVLERRFVFFGKTKPEWTRRTRVPSATLKG